MVRLLLVIGILAVMAMPATAGLVNGDFSQDPSVGWTRWWAPWGTGNWGLCYDGPWAPEGELALNPGQTGSFGWYQTVACPVGATCTISGVWNGNIGSAGWAEVMLWSQSAPGGEGARADTGNAADIAFKKDSWGLNPPTSWSWESIALSPLPGGNGGTVVSQGYVVVALKLGSVSGSMAFAELDNLVLTCIPEPGSIVALLSGLVGLGGFAIRRRR